MNRVSLFVKYQRKKLALTQEELSAKAGVGIRFIRDLEQGKETLQLNKVNQVLALFGSNLIASKLAQDPYDIYWNYFNKPVKITLTNKISKQGIIVKEINDPRENKIIAWHFVANNKAIQYQQKPDKKLIEEILHSAILEIEEQ